MKLNDVPQDDADILQGKIKDLQYALDENGNYVAVKSLGWETKNIVMQEAWQVEMDKINDARELVKSGKKSPVFYHMTKKFMDVQILSGYTGFFQFTVKRHFKPSVFAKLSDEKLAKYVEAFGLKSIDELMQLD